MRFDVSVIGLYILDVLGRPVPRIPERGNVEFIEEIQLTVAGTAGGTVVDTAKLGLRSLAVGAVGDDEKADWVLHMLGKHGVDSSATQRLPGVPTSATILNVRPNGDRPGLYVRGASDHFTVPEALEDLVFDAPIVHLGGTGLLRALDGAASAALLRAAKARGRIVTFDLIAAHAGTLALVDPLLPFIDFFLPSIEEARDMSGQKTPEDCARFYLDRGTTCCVFTLGAEGAYYAHRDGTRWRRRRTRSTWSTRPAVATPSTPASSPRCITASTPKPPSASPRRRPGWWPPGWDPTPASCRSSTRSRRCGRGRSRSADAGRGGSAPTPAAYPDARRRSRLAAADGLSVTVRGARWAEAGRNRAET
jgi:sugar/nucleoside kinase (ribokinase family)